MRVFVRLLLTICASIVLLGSEPLFAQKLIPQDKAKRAKQLAKQKWIGQKSGARQQLELLMQMPPEQREQYLAQLPPKQRAALEELASLPPEQRAIRLRRLDIMNSLSPERQQAVRREIRNLDAMTFVQRRARLHSKEFEDSYTQDELELLRDRFPGAAR